MSKVYTSAGNMYTWTIWTRERQRQRIRDRDRESETERETGEGVYTYKNVVLVHVV